MLRDKAWREMHQRKLETSASFCPEKGSRRAYVFRNTSDNCRKRASRTYAQSQLRTFGTKLTELIAPAVSSPYA